MKRAKGWQIVGAAVVMTVMMMSVVQAQQPTVVVSIRGIEELLEDADFIGGEVGQDGVKELVEGQLNALTGGKGLAGIDQKKPLGMYYEVKAGAQEMPVVFLPVSDADDLKELITSLVPDFKDNKGQWTFTVNGTKVFGKISGGYLFASPSATALTKLADPAKIVNTKYDLAFDVSLASVPDSLKEDFLAKTEEGGRTAMENSPEAKNKAEEVGREMGFNGALAALKSLTNDGDRITFGLDVDSDERTSVIDVSLTAKTNTEMSKTMAAFGKTAPLFAGVGSAAAPLRLITAFPTAGLTKECEKLFSAMRESANEEIDKDERLDSDKDKEAAKNVAKRLFDIVQATFSSGSMHSGLVLEPAEEGKVRVIAGTKVAKGDDAAKLLDDLVKLSKESPELAKLKVDVAKHAGARIHEITPDLDEDAEKYLGDEAAHIAIRNDSLWMSIGGDNLNALKKALDQFGKGPSKPVPPISLQVKPAALVVLMEKEDEGLIERAKEINGKPGDKFNLDLAPITNGVKLHIEFGIDLIQLGIDSDEN